MSKVAPDFKKFLPPRVSVAEEDDRPIYYLWTFDPVTTKVHMDHNEDRHPAHALTHSTLAPEVTHPDTVHGFAYSIEGGWRITNDEHKEVKDPYVVRKVMDKLRGKHPEPPLPHLTAVA